MCTLTQGKCLCGWCLHKHFERQQLSPYCMSCLAQRTEAADWSLRSGPKPMHRLKVLREAPSIARCGSAHPSSALGSLIPGFTPDAIFGGSCGCRLHTPQGSTLEMIGLCVLQCKSLQLGDVYERYLPQLGTCKLLSLWRQFHGN